MLLSSPPDARIAARVAALPEVYQPIFSHPEYDGPISRPCEDRLTVIADAAGLLEVHLGRPLRILDLGCAQGFFSLSLASRGSRVVGVDIDPANIALCEALHEENGNFDVSFRQTDVREVLEGIVPGEYDLVLGLSVFHHLCHQDGMESVRARIASIVPKVVAAIFEVARHREPLYWAPSQPEDPYWLLQDFPFVHTLSEHGTHLSDIPRPMIYCSGRHWLLGNDLRDFVNWKAHPHEQAVESYQKTRRYFIAGDRIAKLYRFTGNFATHNREELINEQRFLLAPPPSITRLPKLDSWGMGETEGWVVREWLPGELLSERIAQGGPHSPSSVLREVLAQLATLEHAGLYHNDVRTWNVLLSPEGEAQLIDFGSITPHPRDCAWPYDLFLNLILFAHDVLIGKLSQVSPLRPIHLSPRQLPPPYDRWAGYLWRTSPSDWSFAQWLEEFDAIKGNAGPFLPANANELWMLAAEQYLQELAEQDRHGRQELADLRRELADVRHHLMTREIQLQRLANPLRPLIRLVRRLRAIFHNFLSFWKR